jgi:hypothetical protein
MGCIAYLSAPSALIPFETYSRSKEIRGSDPRTDIRPIENPSKSR